MTYNVFSGTLNPTHFTSAEKNSAQTKDKQTDRHYENNGHLAVNQYLCSYVVMFILVI